MHRQLAVALIGVVLMGFTGCPANTKNLAVASDAIAHSLANAQTASKQAVTQGVISAADDQEFENYLSKTSSAGLTLDAAIRKGESAQSVSDKTKAFMDAFSQLQGSGVLGIKNPALQLTISTIITGAETSIALIEATVGGR